MIADKLKERVLGKKLTEKELEHINPQFIENVSPLGGIDFTHEKFIQTGGGYEACIYIYEYPKRVSMHWLTMLLNNDDTIGVVDISSVEPWKVRQNLKRSLEEQNSRYKTAKTDMEMLDAEIQYAELESMYREIASYGKIMKSIAIRIFVAADTMYEAETRVKELMKELTDFKCAVCLNETKQDWRNVFLPFQRQQEGIFAREGQPILSSTLAAGNPFHFSSLSDPHGFYLGQTESGGPVLFDLFYKTKVRVSYDFLCVGKKGSGKSTTLKKILLDRAIRGDIIRIFDVNGEFTMLTEKLGGTIIYLDGQSGNIINILQILPNDENQAIAFENHMSKVGVIYTYLKGGEVSENEILILKQLLRVLYMKCGICNQNGELIRDLKEMQPEDFPILSDLLALTTYMIQHFEKNADIIFQRTNIRENKLPILEDIELKLRDLCTTHGKTFNGHTTINNFYDEKVVCFNVKNLTRKDDQVFDAQIYNALSICFDNCVANGSVMKELVREKKIKEEDIVHFLVLMDESHLTINANKTAGIDEVIRMVREFRKYFGGLGLASQSIRDFIPDRADADAVDKMKVLFELTTYKFMMMQDSNSLPKIREAFQGSFSEIEIESIPMLEQGNCILSIAGDRNLQLKIRLQDEEQYYFDGGR